MRSWRVGTISMGISLILLGIFLFVSLIKGVEAFDSLIQWWPLVLIILGSEVLIYIFFQKNEQTTIKYDLFSLIFLGAIGAVAIGFTLFLSTGVLSEIRDLITTKEQTMELPAFTKDVSSNIERIVLETGDHPVTVEGSNDTAVHIFGHYQQRMKREQTESTLTQEDYVMTKVVDNTMYGMIKDLPKKMGPLRHDVNMNMTVVVPTNRRLEIKGSNNEVSVAPQQLKNHWTVDQVRFLEIHLRKDSNIELSVLSDHQSEVGNVNWDEYKQVKNKEIPGTTTGLKKYHGVLKTGNGQYTLEVLDSSKVNVNVIQS